MRGWEKFVLFASAAVFLLLFALTLFRVACVSRTAIVISGGLPERLELRINVNCADWAEIALLPGIGEKKAKEIIRRREKGSFHKSDIAEIVGKKTLGKIEPYVSFGN